MVTNIEELRAKLAKMTPSQVREIARLGKLHARLTKQARKAHGLTLTQAKVMAKIERTMSGLTGS